MCTSSYFKEHTCSSLHIHHCSVTLLVKILWTHWGSFVLWLVFSSWVCRGRTTPSPVSSYSFVSSSSSFYLLLSFISNSVFTQPVSYWNVLKESFYEGGCRIICIIWTGGNGRVSSCWVVCVAILPLLYSQKRNWKQILGPLPGNLVCIRVKIKMRKHSQKDVTLSSVLMRCILSDWTCLNIGESGVR